METWNERLAQAIAESDYKPHQLAQAQANRQAAVNYYLQTRPVTTNCTRYGNNVSCTGY